MFTEMKWQRIRLEIICSQSRNKKQTRKETTWTEYTFPVQF